MTLTRAQFGLFFDAIAINSVFSGICGLTMVLGASAVAGWLGIETAWWIMMIGAFLMIFSLRLLMIRRQGRADLAEAWSIVVGDVAWVVFSGVLLVVYRSEFSDLGRILIAGTGLIVLGLALTQTLGLRRRPSS